MITQEDIDKFYRDFENMKIKTPNAVMKRASGLSSGNVSDYLKKKKTPSESFIKAFYEKVYRSSINAPRETHDNNEVHEPEAPYNYQQTMSGDDFLRMISNLSESNKILAEAHNKQAEANRQQAEANRLLAENNNKLIDRITENASRQMPPDVDAKFGALLELLSEVAAGKRFLSKQEAFANFYKVLYNKDKTHLKTDSHGERGKLHKGS